MNVKSVLTGSSERVGLLQPEMIEDSKERECVLKYKTY